jgi:rare lipoprotein A
MRRIFCLAFLSACLPAAAVVAQTPSEGQTVRQQGQASYYNVPKKQQERSRGDPSLTAASKTLPRGTKAKVTNTETGKSVDVTITDKGPSVPGRIVDVSKPAAEQLGMKRDGVAPVKVEAQTPPKQR